MKQYETYDKSLLSDLLANKNLECGEFIFTKKELSPYIRVYENMPENFYLAPPESDVIYSTYDVPWVNLFLHLNDPVMYSYSFNNLLGLNESISIFPVLYLGFSLLVLVLYGSLIGSYKEKNYPLVHLSTVKLSVLFLSFSIILVTNTYNLSFSNDYSFFNNSIVFDSLSFYSLTFLLASAALYFILIIQYLRLEKMNSFEYAIILIFSVLGVILICISNDIITVYLSIEVQSLSFYLLASYKKTTVFSTNAGLKYFILGAFSSSLFLFGSSFIYLVTGTTNFEDFKDLFIQIDVKDYSHLLYSLKNVNLLQFGLLFIFISLMFKLSIAPFHIWSPDIYEESSTGSTFFFAVMPKLGLFILLLRFFNYSFFTFLNDWVYYFTTVAVISIIIGSFAGVEQRKMKTLLAYSSISHMGYLMLALSTFTFQGVQSLITYLLIYIFSGLCIWSIILSLKLNKSLHVFKNTSKNLADLSKLFQSNKVMALCLTGVLFSIAGFPPLIGFYVKLNVFLAALESSLYLASGVALLCSVISAFYYIRLIKIIYFENSVTGKLFVPVEYQNCLIIGVCFYLFFYLFINPNYLYLISYDMSFIGYSL